MSESEGGSSIQGDTTDDDTDSLNNHPANTIMLGTKRLKRQNAGIKAEPEALVYFTEEDMYHYGKVSKVVPVPEDRVANKQIKVLWSSTGKSYPAIFLSMGSDHAELVEQEMKHMALIRATKKMSSKSAPTEKSALLKDVVPSSKIVKKRGRKPKEATVTTNNDPNNIAALFAPLPSMNPPVTTPNPVMNVTTPVSLINPFLTPPNKSVLPQNSPPLIQTSQTLIQKPSPKNPPAVVQNPPVTSQNPLNGNFGNVGFNNGLNKRRMNRQNEDQDNTTSTENVALCRSVSLMVNVEFKKILFATIEQMKTQITGMEKLLAKLKSQNITSQKKQQNIDKLESKLEKARAIFPTKICRMLFRELFGDSVLEYTAAGSTRFGKKNKQAPPHILDSILVFLTEKVATPVKTMNVLFNEFKRDFKCEVGNEETDAVPKKKRRSKKNTAAASSLNTADVDSTISGSASASGSESRSITPAVFSPVLVSPTNSLSKNNTNATLSINNDAYSSQAMAYNNVNSAQSFSMFNTPGLNLSSSQCNPPSYFKGPLSLGLNQENDNDSLNLINSDVAPKQIFSVLNFLPPGSSNSSSIVQERTQQESSSLKIISDIYNDAVEGWTSG